jgi:hypothetical protein
MKNPKNSTPSAATSASASAASPTPAPRTGLQTAALGILHVGTAGWIGYGALMKALEFNPNLLPGPILSLLQWVMKSTSVDPDLLMTWSLRTIIGAEVFIALAILLSTRYARILAILTLSLFCAILAYAMVTTALKDGIVEALTGGCGCFGEKGLPASVMFSIDAVLLLNALLLVPRARGGSFVPLIATFVIGVVAVFAVREPEVVAPMVRKRPRKPQTRPKRRERRRRRRPPARSKVHGLVRRRSTTRITSRVGRTGLGSRCAIRNSRAPSKAPCQPTSKRAIGWSCSRARIALTASRCSEPISRSRAKSA